jgi:mono/diheme cytochrome c family protein
MWSIAAFTPFYLTSCDYNSSADYNPRGKYEAFIASKEEAQKAQDNIATKQSPVEMAMAAGKKAYTTYCSSCHGADGAANSPTAMALNPKPRALTDKKWQASVDDAHITKVIKEGGAAVGLSATMAPWGGVLSDEDIKNVVAYVRSFAK